MRGLLWALLLAVFSLTGCIGQNVDDLPDIAALDRPASTGDELPPGVHEMVEQSLEVELLDDSWRWVASADSGRQLFAAKIVSDGICVGIVDAENLLAAVCSAPGEHLVFRHQSGPTEYLVALLPDAFLGVTSSHFHCRVRENVVLVANPPPTGFEMQLLPHHGSEREVLEVPAAPDTSEVSESPICS